jgi:outer membrane protein assembly factor BamB
MLLVPLIIVSLFAISCVSPLATGGGCAGPGAQGWSGFIVNNGILYVGSMAGKVMALDPSARSKGLRFPDEIEWIYDIKDPAPANPCGPLMSCGPTAASSGVKIYGTPVATEDLVYVGTYSGQVYALNSATGALRWVYPRVAQENVGAIVGNMILANNTIYIGSSNGKVYALDAATGDLKWEFDTGDKIWTSPAVSGDVVYIGNYGNKFYALSSQDGSQIWQVDLPVAVASSPVVSGDSIFFGTFDRHLYAIDKSDGRMQWKFKGGNWFWAEPLIVDRVVYAACLDHRIYAVDADTGKELWKFIADNEIVSKPVLVDNLLVAISESGEMHLLDSSTGVLQGSVSIGSTVMAPLYSNEEIVYVHARDRYVYAIDVKAGEIAWKFKTDMEQN